MPICLIMQRALSQSMLSVIMPIKAKLEVRNMDASQIVLHASIAAVENLIRSSDSLSPCRQITLSLLIEILVHAPSSVFAEKDSTRLQSLCNKMLALANLSRDIASSCETTFLFFHTGASSPHRRFTFLLSF